MRLFQLKHMALAETQLTGIMNDTKWDELRLQMYNLGKDAFASGSRTLVATSLGH